MVARVPAAMIQSRFSAAASGRPSTGAATNGWPRCACSRASSFESRTLIVLIEMWIASPPRASIAADAPKSVSRTASSLASIVMRTSAPLTASDTDDTAIAPASSSAAALARVRLKTRS